MTMTQPEKLGVLADWARAINETNARIDDLHKVTGMCDGPLIESIWRLQDVATDMAAWVVGDEEGWLEWFRNENGMGAREHEAGPKGQPKPIKSLDDLLWLLEVAA